MVDKVQIGSALLTGSDKTKNDGKAAEANSPKKSANGLNVDQFGLSTDARNKVVWAKAQFELNYQVLKSVNSSQGYETTRETFSFKGSYEFLQQASGGELPVSDQNSTGAAVDKGTAAEETPEADQLSMLQKYFSPENTAKRILDVATSFFGLSETGRAEGDNESARRKFADFIGGAISIGFQQARAILGELPKDVDAGIGKTHSLVFAGLEDFVKNGIPADKSSSGGVFEKIAAYRKEAAAAQLALNNKSSSSVGYNSSGEVQTGQTETPKIITKG